MPNTTILAAATGLPNSRRAVLRSILAAGAVATVPATGAMAAAGHPDAALLALQADIEAADRLKDASYGPLEVAEKAYFAARRPLPAAPSSAGFTDEEWFVTLRERMAELRACPSPEVALHVAACEAWVEEDKRLRDETGLAAARERDEEIDADVLALRDEIVATRATTLAGLKFKAKYAVDHYSGEPDEEVLASIAHDLLAMSAGGQNG
jgi:hypothetical protein